MSGVDPPRFVLVLVAIGRDGGEEKEERTRPGRPTALLPLRLDGKYQIETNHEVHYRMGE